MVRRYFLVTIEPNEDPIKTSDEAIRDEILSNLESLTLSDAAYVDGCIVVQPCSAGLAKVAALLKSMAERPCTMAWDDIGDLCEARELLASLMAEDINNGM